MPKGVMWRHEDFFYACCLGGSPFDPIKEPAEIARNAQPAFRDEPARARPADARRWPVADAHLACSAATGRSSTASGRSTPRRCSTSRRGSARRRSASSATRWRGRSPRPCSTSPDRWDVSSIIGLGNGGAMLSARGEVAAHARVPGRRAQRQLRRVRDRRRGQRGRREHHARPPRVRDRRPHLGARPRHARAARTGIGRRKGCSPRKGNIPLGYWKDPEKTAADLPHRSQRCAVGRARRLGDDRRRGPHRVVRAGLGLHQHGRREGLPRRGRGRDPRPSRRVRRGRRRRARRAVGPEGRRARLAARRRAGRSRSTRCRSTAAR